MLFQAEDGIRDLVRARGLGDVYKRQLLANNAEAEEIVQDSFVEVHRRWPDIRKPGAYLRLSLIHI